MNKISKYIMGYDSWIFLAIFVVNGNMRRNPIRQKCNNPRAKTK